MRIKRMCKICGEEFNAIKVTQFFCKRRCFKKDYYLRSKQKTQQTESKPSYPIRKCAFCDAMTPLTFDPVRSPKEFDAWGCPVCGVSNQIIWQYRDNDNSYAVIKSILASGTTPHMQYELSVMEPLRTYHLQPNLLENADTRALIIMACEANDLMKLQKNNRKRILFS